MVEERINQSLEESHEDTSSYRSIFKATSLFGGLQVYQIIISAIKSKFIAVLLGPSGMGILGLYQSATLLIQSLTSMGLASSAVRDVSEANGTGDQNRINRVVTVLRRLVWITGLLGAALVVALSPVLSVTTFGNYDYTIPFIALSLTLLLDQLCSGQRVVLQGMRKLRELAQSSAVGVTVSLIVSVPLYYWLGVDGIVPTLILNSFLSLLFTWLYSRKIRIIKPQMTMRETVKEGATMLKMGWAMSLSFILSYLSSYALRGYIRFLDGTDAVGLYTAGFTIITTYVGMIFTAIGTDFYPRLAAVNKDVQKSKEIINQQGEITSLILGPLLVLCVFFMSIVVRLLYSEKFLGANDFILLAVPGMMFKLGSWLVAYQFIAKADMKLFIINEIAAGLYTLFFQIIGYKYYGLMGLGIAFSFCYLLYMIEVILCTRYYYSFRFTRSFIMIFSLQCIAVIVCLIVRLILGDSFLCYGVGLALLLVVTIWSFVVLNKKIQLSSYIQQKFRK